MSGRDPVLWRLFIDGDASDRTFSRESSAKEYCDRWNVRSPQYVHTYRPLFYHPDESPLDFKCVKCGEGYFTSATMGDAIKAYREGVARRPSYASEISACCANCGKRPHLSLSHGHEVVNLSVEPTCQCGPERVNRGFNIWWDRALPVERAWGMTAEDIAWLRECLTHPNKMLDVERCERILNALTGGEND